MLIELMGNIITSNYTKTDTEKLIDCFDMALVMIKTSFVGAEMTLDRLNGELKPYLEEQERLNKEQKTTNYCKS